MAANVTNTDYVKVIVEACMVKYGRSLISGRMILDGMSLESPWKMVEDTWNKQADMNLNGNQYISAVIMPCPALPIMERQRVWSGDQRCLIKS
jgi:hypothetical protein